MSISGKTRSYILIFTLSLLCIIETLCFTRFQLETEWRHHVVVLYFATGVFICFTSLLFAVVTVKEPAVKHHDGFLMWCIKISFALATIKFAFPLFINLGKKVFPALPITMQWADMLPLIKVACERFIQGMRVYQPVPNIWGGETLIPYLPAMWLPYVPFVFFDVDMRWANIVFTLAGFAILITLVTCLEWKKYLLAAPVIFFLLVVIAGYLTSYQRDFYLLSEEPVPTFYYLLLFIALMLNKYRLVGIALALCTISRFSLLPFLPFLGLSLIFNKHAPQLKKIFIPYTVVLALLFLPFFIYQPLYFLQIPFRYLDNKDAFWIINNYNIQSIPGLGLAYFAGYANRHLLASMNFPFLLIVPLLWLLCFRFLRKKFEINQNIWIMGGLKLSLVFFYNFISVPQFYLFMVPTLISYPLLLAVVKESDI